LVRVHKTYVGKTLFGPIGNYIEKLLNEGYSIKISKADEIADEVGSPEIFVIKSWKPPKKVNVKSENLKETQ